MISWKKRGIVLCLILPLALVGCAEKQKEGEGELWEGDHGRENRKERER